MPLSWTPTEVEHPTKGVIMARHTLHPSMGDVYVYPIDWRMGMWCAYVPQGGKHKTGVQHFLGVFGADGYALSAPEITPALWEDAQTKAEMRLESALS